MGAVIVIMLGVCSWLALQWADKQEPVDPALMMDVDVPDEERPVGYVSGLEGTATAEKADGTTRFLSVGDKVFIDESLVTPDQSRMQVTLLDGTVLNQGSLSEIKLVEYVFNPEVNENNVCTIEMERGVFRAITDKITKLNPEKFKVKTRSATIGIRGCEVGFRLTETGEAIYMMEISEDRSVVVSSDDHET